MTRVTEWLESKFACKAWFENLRDKGHPVAIISRNRGYAIYSVWRDTVPHCEPDRWYLEYRIEQQANDFEEVMSRETSKAHAPVAR